MYPQEPILLAKERASRLKRLRNLANLSRKELCDGAKVNINTYIGYEVGRYGGLTSKGAYKILSYIESKGVIATFDWLMHNKANGPLVVSTDTLLCSSADENTKITSELSLFQKHYPNSISLLIPDDGMEPKYTEGDIVAGVKCTLNTKLIGKDCLVQTDCGIYARNLRANRNGGFNLYCCNPSSSVANPIIYDANILEIAIIIWHRRAYHEHSYGE